MHLEWIQTCSLNLFIFIAGGDFDRADGRERESGGAQGDETWKEGDGGCHYDHEALFAHRRYTAWSRSNVRGSYVNIISLSEILNMSTAGHFLFRHRRVVKANERAERSPTLPNRILDNGWNSRGNDEP